jgi:Fic family protein
MTSSPRALLDFSAYIERRREEYYARLLAVSTDGDWTGWITFFLTWSRTRQPTSPPAYARYSSCGTATASR